VSNKRSTVAILGGVGASLALGISAVSIARTAGVNRNGHESVSATANFAHSCVQLRVRNEIRTVARDIRADGLISITPIAPSLRLAEREEAIAALKSAVNTWNSALKSVTTDANRKLVPVRIAVREESDESDIQVEFSRVAYTSAKPVAGSIRWQDHAGESWNGATRTMVLTVGTFNSQGVNHSLANMTNTIAHQIGHALGLSDLPNTGGIMDSETVSAAAKNLSGADLSELTLVLGNRDEVNCRSHGDARWIY